MPVKGKYFDDPKNFEERKKIATTCCEALDLKIPTLVDGVDDKVGKAYKGWPDRLYIVGKDGKIAYRGGPGPFGFQPAEMETRLRAILKMPQEGSLLKARPKRKRP